MDLEQLLTNAGLDRRDVERERGEASALLRGYVRDAAAEGWSKTRIAEVAGVSRQTVHEMLKDEKT